MANRHSYRLGRLIAALILIMLFVQLAAPRTSGAAEFVVQKDTASADFPNGISFQLVTDSPERVTDLELRYHPAFAAVTQVARPDFQPGDHLEVNYQLDLRTNYLPPGIDIVYHWRVTHADGSTVDTPDKTVFYMDGHRTWRTLSANPVTLYYYAGNPSFAQEALDTLSRSITRFDETFGVTTDQPIRVVMYGSEHDFSNVLPLNSDEWIGGFADPELHLIVVGILPGDTTEVNRMLSHEVVHIVMDQATANPFNEPPTWLNEGLASYYQEVQDDRFGPLLSRAIRAGKLDSVRSLNSGFPSDPDAALLSYAESESIVRFIVEELGAQKMAALINVFQQGISYDDAVQQSLGMSFDELDAAWKEWLGYHGQAMSTFDSGGDSSAGIPDRRAA